MITGRRRFNLKGISRVSTPLKVLFLILMCSNSRNRQARRVPFGFDCLKVTSNAALCSDPVP